MAMLNFQKISKHLRLIAELYNASDKSNKFWAARCFNEAAYKLNTLPKDYPITRLREVKGIGSAIQHEIEAFVDNNYHEMTEKYMELASRMTDNRVPHKLLEPIVEEILEHFTSRGFTIRVAGSYRRKQLTSKDLDFVVQMDEHETEEFEAACMMLCGFDKAYGGDKRISGTINTLPIDFRLVHGCMVPAMLFFTGPMANNVIMRGRAKARGYKLNEYGLFKRDTGERVLHPESFERDYYDFLGVSTDGAHWLNTDHVETKKNDPDYMDQQEEF